MSERPDGVADECAERPWPTELRLKNNGKTLAVSFGNGERTSSQPSSCRWRAPAPR